MFLTFLVAVLCLGFGYLSGSLSSAVIICKLLGLSDPRESGSKNPGATNVARIAGKKVAFFVLVGDVLKSLLPILLIKFILKNDLAVAAVGVGAFLGHLYPLFFGFVGGKGVATLVGVLLGVNWLVFVTFGIIWLTVLSITKYVSLSSIVGSFFCILAAYFYHLSPIFMAMFLFLAILVAYRHKDNIKRILSGNEPKINQKK